MACENCDRLARELRQLKKLLAPAVDIPVEWGLPRAERVIFDALFARKNQWVAKDRLTYLLWGDADFLCDRKREPTKTIESHISKLRRRLAKFTDATIENSRNVGYRLVWRESPDASAAYLASPALSAAGLA